MPRGSSGTNQRKALDVRRVSEALKSAGIDPRHWCSYATVGTVGDDGKFDPTDESAVFIDKAGVEVDVLLEPLNIACTCLYTGIQGGDKVSIMSPIKPGDRVLVNLPDGTLTGPPVVKVILHSAHNQMPAGPDTGELPAFQNDRLLIWAAADVPVDMQQAGGSRVELRTNGDIVGTPADGSKVKWGGETDLEDAGLGNSIQAHLDAIKSWADTHIHPDPSSGSTGVPTNPSPDVPDVTSSNVQVKK